jgi:hypothetical protein
VDTRAAVVGRRRFADPPEEKTKGVADRRGRLGARCEYQLIRLVTGAAVLANELIDGLPEVAVGSRLEGEVALALDDDRRAGPGPGTDVVDRLTGLAVDSLERAGPEALDGRRGR